MRVKASILQQLVSRASPTPTGGGGSSWLTLKHSSSRFSVSQHYSAFSSDRTRAMLALARTTSDKPWDVLVSVSATRRPELWHGAWCCRGLCARVHVCTYARVLVPPNRMLTYIYTHTI